MVHYSKCSPATVAGFDALTSVIGLVVTIIGLTVTPSDGTDIDVQASRGLLVTEVVILTMQIFLAFVLYLGGITKQLRYSCCWLLTTIPLLLAQVVVMVIDATVANGAGIPFIVVGFVVSFIMKVPQIFNLLRFLTHEAERDRLIT